MQVISITVLGSQNGTGGFFPNGLLGPINGTASSIGAVDTVPPLPAPSSAIAATASAMVSNCCALTGSFPPSIRDHARRCRLLLHILDDESRFIKCAPRVIGLHTV